jgi:hypothetical protein
LPLTPGPAVVPAAPAPLGAELHFIVLRLARRLCRLGHQHPHGLPAVMADDFAGGFKAGFIESGSTCRDAHLVGGNFGKRDDDRLRLVIRRRRNVGCDPGCEGFPRVPLRILNGHAVHEDVVAFQEPAVEIEAAGVDLDDSTFVTCRGVPVISACASLTASSTAVLRASVMLSCGI